MHNSAAAGLWNTSPSALTCLNCLRCCEVVLPEVNKQEKLEHFIFLVRLFECSVMLTLFMVTNGETQDITLDVWPLWAYNGLIQQI